MSLYKQKNSDVWWVNLSHAGHRVRQSTGCVDKAAAQKVHNELQIALWQAVPKVNEHTWGEAVLEWCKVEQRSSSELLSIKKFASVFPDRGLSQVTPEDIDKALSFCKTAGTYTRYRTTIAAILNLALKHKWVKEVPTLRARKDKKTKPREWITREQWVVLLEELPKHMKPMATFAIETGLRQANVLGLTWEKVDLERKLVWVDAEDMKQDVALAVPLSRRAVAVLRSIPQGVSPMSSPGRTPKGGTPICGADSVVSGANGVVSGQVRGIPQGPVFLYRGKPIGDVKTAFMAACRRAGVGGTDEDGHYEGFTWHGFRHTWATWHVQNGTPLDVLMKLGGWSDMRMVLNYAQHSPGHLAGYADNNSEEDEE